MAVYDKDGNTLSAVYDADGNSLTYAYDASGTEIFSGSSEDYPEYDSDYQYAILTARNEWATEYRADDTVVPIVLHTDQHGTLSKSFGTELFDYLALAVNWDECSACLNLGDVCNYSESGFQSMQTCLSDIPQAKQINIIGNHDTWGDWTDDDSTGPSDEEWAVMYEYFDNSNYNGYVNYGTHQSAESMIDEEHGIKYVVFGTWNYDMELGGHSHYAVDSDNMDAMIEALSVVDDYDIVLLSHIQPYASITGSQVQADGSTTWYRPATDGNTASKRTGTLGALSSWSPCYFETLIDGRRDKTSGVVYDSYGGEHAFDFTACTSNLICSFHGHVHADLYGWHGSNRDFPVMILDALHYDYQPFYFININRTSGMINLWKVDNTATIYRYSVSLDQADDETEYEEASS